MVVNVNQQVNILWGCRIFKSIICKAEALQSPSTVNLQLQETEHNFTWDALHTYPCTVVHGIALYRGFGVVPNVGPKNAKTQTFDDF